MDGYDDQSRLLKLSRPDDTVEFEVPLLNIEFDSFLAIPENESPEI